MAATHINYFFACKRKLWLFSRKIQCEQESELVKIGKIYHDDFEKDNIEIGNIKIDKLKDGKVFAASRIKNLFLVLIELL
ncbi:Dna2/Cas4 domain-containing protein [Candidatus Woesearchaeota archaeon]|nr:Dna2/Cas4 domain-containing protein [Candidatus Woesearchaeota archaeon]